MTAVVHHASSSAPGKEAGNATRNYGGRPDDSTRNLEFVTGNAKRNDPQSVLRAMDEFARQSGGLMHVGDVKGDLIVEKVLNRMPQPTLFPLIMIELGAFMGYSAVRFASALCARFGSNNVRYISFEVDKMRVEYCRKLVEYAGLAEVVQFVPTSLAEGMQQLQSSVDGRIDVVFLDHRKDLYLSDAQRLLESGLLCKGSILVADNVVCPGAPEYLEFVRSNKNLDSKYYESLLEYTSDIVDGIEVSIVQ